MVASDGQDIWFFPKQDWQGRIQFRNRVALGGEVAVFPLHVSVLVVDEEETVLLVFTEIALELLGNGLRTFQFGHAHELRQALVHGIDRDATGAQAIAVSEHWDRRLMGNAAEQKTVGR